MAVFSKGQITGTIIINAHAMGNGTIVNFTDKEHLIKNVSSQHFGIDKVITKIHPYSIKSDYVEIAPMGMQEISNSDFTFCLWSYAPLHSSYNYDIIIEDYDASSIGGFGGIYLRNYNRGIGLPVNEFALIMQRGDGNYDVLGLSLANKSFAQWNYYTIAKKGSMMYYFRDGKLLYSQDISNICNYYLENKGDLRFYSGFVGANNKPHYVDDIVLIKDQCLWTEDFALPTEPLIGDLESKQVIFPHHKISNLKLFVY